MFMGRPPIREAGLEKEDPPKNEMQIRLQRQMGRP